MKTVNTLLVALFVSVFFLSTSSTLLAQVPAGQTAGGILQQEEMKRDAERLEGRIGKEKEAFKEESLDQIDEKDVGPKAMVSMITVEGVVLLPPEDINDITARYEGKELTLRTMQKVADLITDEYRKAGYATSRAYLPPQSIQDGFLLIRVVEGRLGNVTIEGNRYFSSDLLERRMGLTSGNAFDYAELQSALTRVNEHPDRDAKVTLAPGKVAGTTDIIVEVEDRFPIHAGFEYDNFGTRFIDEDRFSTIFEHNNLMGWDDKLYLEYERSEGDLYWLGLMRYTFPINNRLDVGTYFAYSETELAKQFKPMMAEGESLVAGFFTNFALIDKLDLDVVLNFGFDYKDITNDLFGINISEDNVRMLKMGLDVDYADRWGRTIFTPELDIGIPDIMGGMDPKDANASRMGAGGKFYKAVANLFRLQPAFLDSTILWKNQGQFSRYNLVASEQFQIGGPYSVRGYPPAEFSGDGGYYTSFEWSFPPYGIPPEMKVPFLDDSLYDAFRVVAFYDWGYVNVNRTLPGQEQHQTLQGCGFGFRLNLSNSLTARVEVGYPLGKEASDGENSRTWVEFTKHF
ncbi:ShlB/FhaC/HecB family hemolysin secretion/activation protein [Candidatus Omnitrophota bacterium]